MTSKSVALLTAALGVTKTHSRPRVTDDNPYSACQFKTVKYRPEFPERFTHNPPKHPPQPTAVGINPPKPAIPTNQTERNLF